MKCRALLMCLLPWLAVSAHASLITFNDLPVYHEEDPDLYDPSKHTFVSDQYSDLGVLFGGGPIVTVPSGEWGAVSPPNALNNYSDPTIYIYFDETKPPDLVSFTINTLFEDAPFIQAYDTGGSLLDSRFLEGWQGTPETSTPYLPNQVYELDAADIGTLVVGSLFARRSNVYLDDLYFRHPPSKVNEPTGPALLAFGLFALLMARRFSGSDRFRVT